MSSLKKDRKRLRRFSRKNILGGEVALWGEKVDASNIFVRLLPRLSAV